MPKLIATKSLVYATRRLLPGDEFEASRRDAHLLEAVGKAKPMRIPGKIAPPPKKGQGGDADDGTDLDHLRAQYATVLGKKPFPGWDAAELQRRIDEASKG